jgi:methyl-accepting chemotaxis protein
MEELAQRVDYLERDKIPSIEKDINDIKIGLTENTLLTKQSIETSEKLANTMENVKDCMTEMAQSLKDNNKISSELTQAVGTLNQKVEDTNSRMERKFNEVDERIENVNEKSKVDILSWIRDNWFKVVLTAGALGYVVAKIIKDGGIL